MRRSSLFYRFLLTASLEESQRSSSVSLSLHTSRRSLQVPPGGFTDPLPPSFGKQSGKGRISNVNLRQKEIAARKLKKSKKKLLSPSSSKLKRQKLTGAAPSDETVSLENIKKELEQLIKRSERFNTHYKREEEKEVAVEKERQVEDAPKEQFNETQRSISEEDQDHTFQGVDPFSRRTAAVSAAATLLDDTLHHHHHQQQQEETRLVAPRPPVSVHQGDTWEAEQQLERRYAVTPHATVFGSDLDRLEEDIRRDYQQHSSRLPPLDPVYSQFGGGIKGHRMRWEPSSSFDALLPEDLLRNEKEEKVVGVRGNRNVSAYHMEAEAYREKMERARRRQAGAATAEEAIGRGVNLLKDREGNPLEGNDDSQPAEVNSHFPTEEEDLLPKVKDPFEAAASLHDHDSYFFDRDRVIKVDARKDYKNKLTVRPEEEEGEEAEAERNLYYDAYLQRPGEQHLLSLRGTDYWASYENRSRLEAHELTREERVRQEVLQEGAMDTSHPEYSTSKLRTEAFLYYKAHPINEMIQESFVRIRQILPKGGGVGLTYNPMEPQSTAEVDPSLHHAVHLLNADTDIPLREARRMAQNLGLDLIRTGSLYTDKSDRRIIALCTIADHREHLRDMLRFKIQKLGVQPPPPRTCIEVIFRGGTHPHGIRFKSIGIAKHILHRHPIRINLMKFGTPREGFPVLQTILDEVRKQCMRLKAYHTVGEIQANYNEIFCYLYPSTGKSPKTTVQHPTPAQVKEAQEFYTLQTEKEIFFDDLQDKVNAKERLRYRIQLDKGLAWSDKDDGLTLQKQRAIKIRQGFLPKGNSEMYAARGDVNIPAPFRASHQTTTERWSHPRESNLEQAGRGAAVLGKRMAMDISEMHDAGETPENPSLLDRFYYKVQGPALEVGEFKEALGLKDNRKRQPPLAPGFATLGMQEEKRGRGTSTK